MAQSSITVYIHVSGLPQGAEGEGAAKGSAQPPVSLPPYGEEEATRDLIEELNIACVTLTHEQISKIVSEWMEETAWMNQPHEPERSGLTGLTETAPDMRYRGLGFCDKGDE